MTTETASSVTTFARFGPSVAILSRARFHHSRRQALLPCQRFCAQTFHYARVLFAHIVLLPRIRSHIVEFHGTSVGIQKQLPLAFPNRQHRASIPGMVENGESPLPKQRFASPKTLIAAQRSRNALPAQGLPDFTRHIRAGDFAKRRK